MGIMSNIIVNIINYLNAKTGKAFKYNNKKTVSLIQARQAEGYTLEDFIKVIDIKTGEWLKTDMNKYLRPETLFGNKFESYLNQQPMKKGISENFEGRIYNDDFFKSLENQGLEMLRRKEGNRNEN